METKVNGMTFVNKDPIFAELRPEGLLTLVPDPENKYDENAVAVYAPHPDGESDPIRVGYLPATDKKSPEMEEANIKLQKWVIEQMKEDDPQVYCIALKYSYYDKTRKKEDRFNDDHEGVLQSIRIYVTDDIQDAREYWKQFRQKQAELFNAQEGGSDASGSPSIIEVTDGLYRTNKGDYSRLTHVLGCFEPDGEDGKDRITQWAMEQGIEAIMNMSKADRETFMSKSPKEAGTILFKAYKKSLNKTADDGTDIHKTIEDWINADPKDRDDSTVPKGFLNWWKKYNPTPIATETTVFDDIAMVAGTYDFRCFVNVKGKKQLWIVDWKSSKAVRKKHRTQAGFLGHHSQADASVVVALGASTAQGYSQSIIDTDEMERSLIIVHNTKESVDLS
jgi:hypothetical protein